MSEVTLLLSPTQLVLPIAEAQRSRFFQPQPAPRRFLDWCFTSPLRTISPTPPAGVIMALPSHRLRRPATRSARHLSRANLEWRCITHPTSVRRQLQGLRAPPTHPTCRLVCVRICNSAPTSTSA